jgi:hypothetical protein
LGYNPGLKSLYLCGWRFTDAVLNEACKMPGLKMIRLGPNQTFSDAAVAKLVRSCRNLPPTSIMSLAQEVGSRTLDAVAEVHSRKINTFSGGRIGRSVTVADLRRYVAACPNLRSVALDSASCPVPNELLDMFLLVAPRLVRLVLHKQRRRNAWYDATTLTSLLSQCSSLESMVFACPVLNDAALEALCRVAPLKSLTIERLLEEDLPLTGKGLVDAMRQWATRSADGELYMLKLDGMELADNELYEVACSTAKLKTLNLRNTVGYTPGGLIASCGQWSSMVGLCVHNNALAITDIVMPNLVQAMGGTLANLNLAHATQLTDTGGRVIVSELRQLTTLVLTGCFGLTNDTFDHIGCTKLETMVLTDCVLVGDAAMQKLARFCPELAVLKVKQTNVREAGIWDVCTSSANLHTCYWTVYQDLDDAQRLMDSFPSVRFYTN